MNNTNDDHLKYKIGIGLIPLIGCKIAKRLIAYTGSVEAIFNEKKGSLLKIPGIGEGIANAIVKQNIMEEAEKEIEFINKYNINTLFYLDNNYPERLQHCEDAPVILFVKGSVDLNPGKVISIVGTRNATRYGREMCNKIVSGLSEHHHDIVIVSGLAYGIDVCSHKAALKNNLLTVAVLGHGLSTIYPAGHNDVAKKIIKQGALVTEFTSNMGPEKQNFVQRNRIIAGLSDATLVVESDVRGGALITADLANSYYRDVFAIPGRSEDKYSSGCNKLIKTNKAALLESVEDIEYIMGWDREKEKPRTTQRQLFTKLVPEEQLIYNLLKEQGDLTIDILCLKANMPVSKVSAILLNMEFAGVVRSLPGKIYSAIE